MIVKNIYMKDGAQISREDANLIWEFYNYSLDSHKSENTAGSYELDVRHFAQYLSSYRNMTLRDVKPADIEEYFMWLEEHNKSKASLNRVTIVLSKFYEFLYEHGFINNEVPVIYSFKTEDKKEIHGDILSDEERALILKSVDSLSTYMDIRDITIILLILYTGMRTDEIINLRIQELNFVDRCVVCGNGNKIRTIPLSDEVITALNKYLNIARLSVTDVNSDKGLVFLGARQGGSLTRWGLIKLIGKYCSKIGIERKITPKILRDTFISDFYKTGVSPEKFCEIVGITNQTFISFYSK